ncbi:SRPBCC family protein [Frankia sp. AgB1.9]|uniref:SRPBCC family protein n=1 Tax=unclassified Frankia TaxID=2632575 RepID=UPI001932E97C|nr:MULTISPECIES: SRPBCC family protein [unclassified Frankia]MBL7489805.1 SRPBCC family protein [Frankia sp. AgW1.1]MBL7550265.1 SRPBCC family protein [Frankia sp. AgB1.9]MBL7623058.1 SRPBCC family protein [Frankia sp. AgB1.8]
MNGHTDNSIYVDADLESVFRLTNDLTTWPQLFTEYASVEILEARDNTFKFRLTMHPDENGQVWSWVSERTVDPVNHRVRAYRVETGPFEFMHIEWTYLAEGAGTRMRWVQDFRMKPTAPVDTAGMVVRINTNTPREQASIKEKVEKLAAAAALAAGTAR